MNAIKDEIGVDIIIVFVDGNTDPIDISEARYYKMIVLAPSGLMYEWTARLAGDGKDGKIIYTTTAEGAFNEAGTWRIQGFYEDNNGKFWKSTITRIMVKEDIFAFAGTTPMQGQVLGGYESGVIQELRGLIAGIDARLTAHGI
jgi:hypothetical protein